MKKKYSKPDIMFESFVLSTSIAGECITRTYGEYECAVLFTDGKMVFTTQVQSCATKVVADADGDGMWGTYCYHVPGGKAIFNS